ncbi:class III signal peptide-containing protein [Methanothermococcus sp. Ax23]|uniref:class III signal peptide-containing protein n=1 Tax=Methanothermococcus sp. Ax23 TaxID=3156486 RepID=UPI003BA1731A
MKLLKKLTSKKGQVSMEIGILVAAAVAVAAIAAYYYVKNVKSSAKGAEVAASDATSKLGNKTVQASELINNTKLD